MLSGLDFSLSAVFRPIRKYSKSAIMTAALITTASRNVPPMLINKIRNGTITIAVIHRFKCIMPRLGNISTYLFLRGLPRQTLLVFHMGYRNGGISIDRSVSTYKTFFTFLSKQACPQP
jgi:hypothetical protein